MTIVPEICRVCIVVVHSFDEGRLTHNVVVGKRRAQGTAQVFPRHQDMNAESITAHCSHSPPLWPPITPCGPPSALQFYVSMKITTGIDPDSFFCGSLEPIMLPFPALSYAKKNMTMHERFIPLSLLLLLRPTSPALVLGIVPA